MNFAFARVSRPRPAALQTSEEVLTIVNTGLYIRGRVWYETRKRENHSRDDQLHALKWDPVALRWRPPPKDPAVKTFVALESATKARPGPITPHGARGYRRPECADHNEPARNTAS